MIVHNFSWRYYKLIVALHTQVCGFGKPQIWNFASYLHNGRKHNI